MQSLFISVITIKRLLDPVFMTEHNFFITFSFFSISLRTISLNADLTIEQIYGMGDQSDFGKMHDFEWFSTPSSEHGLKNANVQKLVHATDLHFDLVISEDIYHYSWLMFGYKFKAPTITICMNSSDTPKSAKIYR